MTNTKEAKARLKIDKLLKGVGWILPDDQDEKNVNVSVEFGIRTEKSEGGTTIKPADYVLHDSNRKPLAVIEAKNERKDPLDGKEQARNYASDIGVRFIILSNGNFHYFWDIETGNPEIIRVFPTQQSLISKQSFKPPKESLYDTQIESDYIALSQEPSLENDNRWKTDSDYRQSIISEKSGLRLLRDYQMWAIESLQKAVKKENTRFLFEMATGTGKTLLSAAVIKLFLRSGNAQRILFLVDRLELEQQAFDNLKDYLSKDYRIVVYKENKSDWSKADIVISTVQSLLINNKYRKYFSPTDFDFLISDEAHRSMSGDSREVFEYFIGYKLGLTATPKDYLKNIDQRELSEKDQRRYEKRLLLDTYTTFGCKNSEPTFKYSLTDGVRDHYLVNMIAIDARTDITTKLLSEKGYAQITRNADGSLEDVAYYGRDFEKKFFSKNTNAAFCEGFLQDAQEDPISKEIGKSLVFCVSQAHARKITQLLNQLAHKKWPNKYNSDFAVQVTSDVHGSQESARLFSNNNLNSRSSFLEGYKTSKTRVCVTVGMMTTGYDCQDILNVCLMRPIFSPTDFVQIKGRGTRKYTFKHVDEYKNSCEKEKQSFYLFDFFANCEYFEEKFDYDKPLSVPLKSGVAGISIPMDISEIKITDPDQMNTVDTLKYPKGMKVDRQMWGQFKKEISEDADIQNYVKQDQWQEAEYIIKDKYENKPNYYFNLGKIEQIENLDRNLNWKEVLQYIFGLIERFPHRSEIIDEEIDKFISIYRPINVNLFVLKNFIYAYMTDAEFRQIIDQEDYTKLNHYSGFSIEDFRTLNVEWRQKATEYVREYVNIHRLVRAN
ncbi:MAG: DEAD/DEAH box helicase family protein [Thaumarchaeota archaeon]|nr:DEAD/DEAH box helicase family protein [Nitrososphaerota archaeon]